MNNPQSVGEQLLQLQNIAYVKQFMQKLSVKALFLISLIMAVFSSVTIYMFKDYYERIFDIYLQMFPDGLLLDTDKIESVKSLIGVSITTSAVSTLITSLILPITLLFIIIRSANENPSVIPLGAVRFLYVISFIQTIAIIVSSVFSIIGQGISIFAEEEIISAIISFAFSCITTFISCLYYVFQTKFIGAVKHSSKGISLIYGTSKGFGILSVVYAVIIGISSALYLIAYIIINSLIESNDFSTNATASLFIEIGGIELIKDLKPVFIALLILMILATIYYIAMASVAFAYKSVIAAAIQESFASTKRQTVNVNSAFRTYGGQNSFKNYNYSASSGESQQSYAEIHKNITNNKNASEEAPDVDEPAPNAATYEANPYNTYQGSPVIPEYNGNIPQNNNFYSPQNDFNNMQNNSPVQSGGSFGFQQDTSNNPYNE